MNTKKLVFLIDFDNCLFDAEKFKEEIANKFERITKKRILSLEFWKVYEEVKKKVGYADIDLISKTLTQKYDFLNEKQVKLCFYNQNFKSNNIKGSQHLISNLKKIGKVLIYSLGHPDYQKVKIKKSGFERIIGKQHVFIVQDKINGFKKLLNKYKSFTPVIIDDRVDMLKKARSANLDSILIWHIYGTYAKNNKLNDNFVDFKSEFLDEIDQYINFYVGRIKTPKKIFSIVQITNFRNKYVSDIINQAKIDTEVKKYTHDSKRFKNINSFKKWFSKRKQLYGLISPDNNLEGIVWYSKSSNIINRLKLPEYTFAIRIYKNARGLGLAHRFFELTNSHKKLWLAVNVKNKIAIHLYKKIGFKELATQDEELIMQLI